MNAAARQFAAWGVRTARRFAAHGMPVYAGALTYRGLLALVPLALVFLWLVRVFGVEGSLPRLTGALRHLQSDEGSGVSLTGLLSVGAVVGGWSLFMGARLLMRALNVAHEVEESRPPAVRFALALVLLPSLAFVVALAAALLALASRIANWAGELVGTGALVDLLESWLRFPVALGVVGLAVAALYRVGPSVRPAWRAVAVASALAVGLWVATTLGFALALRYLLDYGATYGSLGAAVGLVVYLRLCAFVVLLGAEVSATADAFPLGPRRSRCGRVGR